MHARARVMRVMRPAQLGVVVVSILGLLATGVGPCCAASAQSCAEVARECAGTLRDELGPAHGRHCGPSATTIADSCCDGTGSQDQSRALTVVQADSAPLAEGSPVHALAHGPRPVRVDPPIASSSPTRFQTILRL